jgi:phosphatidylserine/phosphatidylglycerophosphate/cardiolipin synthase-like enzyme
MVAFFYVYAASGGSSIKISLDQINYSYASDLVGFKIFYFSGENSLKFSLYSFVCMGKIMKFYLKFNLAILFIFGASLLIGNVRAEGRQPKAYKEEGLARSNAYYDYVEKEMCNVAVPESADLFEKVASTIMTDGPANPVLPGKEFGKSLIFPNVPVEGEASTIPLRNGHLVFGKAAELIRNAQREVLIQTFFLDGSTVGPVKYIFPAIEDLYQKKKAEFNSLSPERQKNFIPVRVLFIFDIIGTTKHMNLFQLQDVQRGAGAIDKIKHEWGKYDEKKATGFMTGVGDCFDIHFCLKKREMDPRIMLFQVRAHRHKSLRSVTHAKTFSVDRQVGIVTGINMVNYHFADEMNQDPKNQELMVDHGFLVTGPIAYRMAEDFYTLFWKNTPTKENPLNGDKKDNGFSDFYSSNVPNYMQTNYKDDLFSINHPDNIFTNNFAAGAELWRSYNPNLINLVPNRSRVRAIFAIRDSNDDVKSNHPEDVMKGYAVSAQNRAFGGVFKYAKKEINMTTPSFNSLGFKSFVLDAVKNGVTVNLLLSKNYQDYNAPFQEMGKNSRAVKTTLDEINFELSKSKANPGKVMGSFNVNWFVTRAGFLSGKRAGERYENRIVLNEIFYNHNHTKFLCADGQVAIIGSANLDEQSWFNSHEFNLVIEGPEVVRSWCNKVFKEDYLRGQEYGEKRWSGQYCWKDSQCSSGECLKGVEGGVVSKSIFTLYQGRCVPKSGAGRKGEYCEQDLHCQSAKCNVTKEFTAKNNCQ